MMGLKEFAERLSADSAFAEHYRRLSSEAAVVEQAQKDGYAVTADDLAELPQDPGDGRIGDDELDSVAGGYVPSQTKCPTCGLWLDFGQSCPFCALRDLANPGFPDKPGPSNPGPNKPGPVIDPLKPSL